MLDSAEMMNKAPKCLLFYHEGRDYHTSLQLIPGAFETQHGLNDLCTYAGRAPPQSVTTQAMAKPARAYGTISLYRDY